jgi:hypothetical protein
MPAKWGVSSQKRVSTNTKARAILKATGLCNCEDLSFRLGLKYLATTVKTVWADVVTQVNFTTGWL